MGASSTTPGKSGNQHLNSATAAIQYALFQPGLVCIDYGQYTDLVGCLGAVVACGFGRSEGPDDISGGLDQAYEAWRGDRSGLDMLPALTMLIVGDSLESGTPVRELERGVSRFEAGISYETGDSTLLAMPILPTGATEVAMISMHPAGAE